MLEKDYSRLRLEQYLDRAARERNETDWKRIAEEGLLASMTEWESTHSYLKETDTEQYEAEKKSKRNRNYEYDENNKLTFEGVYNGGKISAACFINSPEEIRRIQKQITNWGVSYNYNVHSIVRNMGIPRYNY